MTAVRRDTAQSPKGKPQETPEKDHTPPSATAKTTETETTIYQTAGTDRTGEQGGQFDSSHQDVATFSTLMSSYIN